jgi:A/G-specific adenine glycosylase
VYIGLNSIKSDLIEYKLFNDRLRSWYKLYHRPLLWRDTRDPYKIWLSEIILQQTRVVQGTPYYVRFLEYFPTIFDLANAEEKEVLRMWQGLGYYSRARNMHYTARQIVHEFGGKFPSTATQLLKLKGLGSYTSAAIASFAFGEVIPAVDGNVYRVLSRLFGISTDILSSDGKREFDELSRLLISKDDPGTYNQAMIELGALQCVPVSPDCDSCPFSDLCYAHANRQQAQLPVKLKKAAVKNRYLNYLIFEQNDRIGMRERRGKGIWQGLYDFFLIESDKPVKSPEMLDLDPSVTSLIAKGLLKEIPGTFVHLLTHQRLHVRFWRVLAAEGELLDLPDDIVFYDRGQVEILPKPILIDQLLKREDFF